MNSSRPSPRGASLIEAMVALVVFSVGILGVMQMNVLASKQNNVAHAHTVASKIARDVADSFERLPFNHPLINEPTTLDPETDAFSDITNDDGLVTLEQAMADNDGRPILGAAQAIFASDSTTVDPDGNEIPFYQVAWRAKAITNPERYDQADQIRIVVMVRYHTPGGGVRDIKTWAVKYNVVAMTGDADTTLEL